MDLADANVLNRLGIGMNFVAAFLLAPELLGERTIARVNDAIASAVKGTGDVLEAITAGGDAHNPVGRAARLKTIVAVLGIAFLYWFLIFRRAEVGFNIVIVGVMSAMAIYVGRRLFASLKDCPSSHVPAPVFSITGSRWLVGGSFLVLPLLVVTGELFGALFIVMLGLLLYGLPLSGIGAGLWERGLSRRTRVFRVAYSVALLPLITSWMFVAFTISVFVEVILAMSGILRFNQGRFRSVLIAIGILLFCMGTACQFWSTFLTP